MCPLLVQPCCFHHAVRATPDVAKELRPLTQWIFDHEPVSDYYCYFTVNLMHTRSAVRFILSAALGTRGLQLVEFYGVIQLQILHTILGGS